MKTVAIVKEVNETELVATWTPKDIEVKVGDWIGVECKEQPAQEPVAWRVLLDEAPEDTDWHYMTGEPWECFKQSAEPLYTHPAPSCQECENLKHDLEGYMDANKALINREWQGLSDDEIEEELKKMWDKGVIPSYSIVAFARAIEQALKEKNT